jgi:hypothetical protein
MFLAGIVLTGCSLSDNNGFAWLEAGFNNPPDNTKPGVYWYWLNEHVSKEGITNDLEALKRIGMPNCLRKSNS